MDMLRQSMAPISEEAWKEIREQAKLLFSQKLTARRFVDVRGPKGWDYGAETLGKMQRLFKRKNGLESRVHRIQPLIEVKMPFQLSVEELDSISRGAVDADLGPMEDAVEKMARFEEESIYYGMDKANIKGLKGATLHRVQTIPKSAGRVLGAFSSGVQVLKDASVEGPYSAVVNNAMWHTISSDHRGYPLRRQLGETLGGKIIPNPYIKEMFLFSERGGDFLLTLGADLSVGYESHDTQKVRLFFIESFTFRVVEPAAVVVYK
jgi:uncharacterized linocin/CFP29 family protein